MDPRILDIPEKKLIGMRIQTTMDLAETIAMWKRFMPRRAEVKNKVNEGFYSLQNYDKDLKMETFTPSTIFEKWAAVEVSNFDFIPPGMETFIIPSGKYAVFLHHGPASTFSQTVNYIHSKWLPNAGFQLDQRPHFEYLDDRYLGPQNPETKEDVWVPII